MSTLPRARYLAGGDVCLSFPYHKMLVECLKADIPSSWRNYDPETKTWTVLAYYAEVAVRLLRVHFPAAVIERPTSRRPSHESSSEAGRPYAVLHLLPSAPQELVDAAFRCLAKIYHPDRGGSDAQMRALNEARELILDESL